MVLVKLPMFDFRSAWMGASGLELPLAQPAMATAMAAAKRAVESVTAEWIFIFIADYSL